MKKSFLILFTTAIGVLVSCSDDDDESVNPIEDNSLIGDWTMVKILKDGEQVDLVCPDESSLFFRPDQTGTLVTKEFFENDFDDMSCIPGEEDQFDFMWTLLDNNSIEFSSGDSDEEPIEAAIVDDTIILDFTIIDEMDNTTEVFQRVFRKQ